MAESTSMEIQPVIASINNEDQDTRKEADIPGGNEKIIDEFIIEIREMAERLEIESSKQCCIYKVPNPLRKWNEEAYTPQVVSIGPFHHENERLKAMEEHKERYYRSFVTRSMIELECLEHTIKKMEERIRGCYEETINLNSDRFVKMILVDASFILELFIRFSSGSRASDDPIFAPPRGNAVRLDLLLLENQLPFFVIEKLFQLAFPSVLDNDGLLKLSFDYFGYFNIHFMRALPNVKIEHFTDLLRTFQLPPLEKQPKGHRQRVKNLYSATQLHEAGVKFEVGTSSGSDIKFEKGVLKIPRFEIENRTEVVARNIMALEQIDYTENAYITDFFLFMGSLIKTGKDVDLLCEKGILDNYLGDNDAVKSMIINLTKGITCIRTRDDYVDLGKKLNRFYDGTLWYRWMAIIRRDLFGTPSAAVSTTISLGLITVLTLIQTVCSIMQVTGSSSKAV